ncbi:hypothetical protein DM2_1471 [Halorubrum sp. DM2]|uniref:hypothetical protein n=1 Tax=unclassified Halorubrum TaxID=2642239 RepID=UPI0003DB8BF9|nr:MULTISPECIES: hypothetical protein [unclassified Halorubrum]CDK40740.1 uncharacterized protein BN903_52 [Halorubrum sp. AJ67]VTT88137.1 hypothetical protein DM2_1471 [Halorubrum sp. DM2]
MTRSSLDGEWEGQPDDPAGDDLGYDLDEWERIRAAGVDSDKFLYLPGDDDLLREEAFVVVAPADVADLVDNR